MGLPQWLSGKESACNSGDAGDSGSIPGLERSPGGGHGNPLQYSRLGSLTESHHFMGNRWGNIGNCQTLFFWAPKSLQMVISAMKLKDAYSLEGKL